MMGSKGLILCGLVVVLLCSVDFGMAKELADDEDKMGMEVLYEMVHFFLGDIIQPKNISESFLNLSTVFVNDDFDKKQLEDWNAWADYAKGYAAGTVIGLLFIVVMPIVGLVFCCCRLCGKCGGRPRKADSRRSKCKRRTYCTLILIFNTLALAGVVCAFMCSSLIHKALKNENDEGTVGHIRGSLQAIKNFTDGAVANVSDTVWDVYNVVSHTAIREINETGTKAVDNVLESIHANKQLDQARDISADVNVTKERLHNVAILLDTLTKKSDELSRNLTDISTDVTTVHPPFDPSGHANFSSLDRLSDKTKEVEKSMDMNTYVQEAEADVEQAKVSARSDIETEVNQAKNSIDEIRMEITRGLDNLMKQKDDAMSFYPSTDKDLHDIDKDLKDSYSDNIFYACIAVSCVYLLIVVMYYMGVVFGLCGERPGHGAPCCNRGTGASFLMAGVAFTFIFSWILMLLCTLLFIMGGVSYTEVCRYFHGHDPYNFQIFDKTLERGLDLSKSLYDDPNAVFSLSQSIRNCQENKAFYGAFKLDQATELNLDKYINIDPLKDKLDELRRKTLDIKDIKILSKELEQKLKNFADAGVKDINFTEYETELDKPLTMFNVAELAANVSRLAEQESDPAIKESLNIKAKRLEIISKEDIPDMQKDVDKLKQILKDLEAESDISDKVDSLISGLNNSEIEFNKNKERLVKEQIDILADNILDSTNKSVNDLKATIRDDTARCAPLSDSIYSVSDSVCVLLIDPLNGLWFSFGWCLFFFVLCLIFGVLLAGEYRHEDKYGKDFDDPYDGRNHDMMPLTRRMDC